VSGAHDIADFVVIGSGAGGATAALVLAEAGHDVIVLEEGPEVTNADRGLGPTEAFARLFRDRGAQIAMGRSVIPILQGRCVGGTTVVNGAIVWRLPEDAHARCFGAADAVDAFPMRDLDRCFDRIERDLSVAQVPDALLGGNGRLMRDGAAKLGWRGHAIRRNVLDCRGSARCLEACPTQQKQSMEVTYLPRAAKLGARILAGREVRTIEVRGDRAVAALGRDANGDTFRVEARRGVVLAASAVQSPCILRRSGLGGRAHVGAHFTGHPATAVMGVYRDPVKLWEGATQSYEVDHFRSEGFKMETASLPLELAGVRIPGFGAEFAAAMMEYPRMAVWGVQVRAEAEGTVAPSGSVSKISYTPTARDMELFRRGVRELAKMHFAAGAVRVLPAVHGGPTSIDSIDDVDALSELSIDPRAYTLIVSHVFGTCRMAKEARDGVVDLDLAVHDVHGLWVVDASVFPTTLGVNPQHTIMALAMLAAEKIAESAPAP
jgi:choline dehydrogenase-like flavoprotein